MGKYLTVYKNSLSTFLQYRLNLGLLIVSHLVSLSGLIYLWLAVYSSGQQMGNYTLEQIIIYYLILTVLGLTIGDGVEMGFEVADDINQGVITNYLLRPFSYAGEQFFRFLGQVSISSLFVAPAVALLVWLARDFTTVPPLINWLQFIIMAFVGLFFYFLIFFLGALSSFWMHRGGHFIYGLLLFSNVLNGSLVPLDLFPAWFVNLSHYLPFPFLMFLPIQVLLGRVGNWPLNFGLAAIWILILISLIVFIWKQGVKKFEAVGR